MPRFLHWFLRFSLLNPICIRLIGAASRRRRDLFLRSIYVAILAAVLFFGMLGLTASGALSLRDLAAGSAGVFTFLAAMQLILICLLTPVFMAGAISKEANPRTWDILLTTPMSPLQIVLGNLFGRLFFIIALLVGALPLMIVTQFFGGVPLDTILLTQLVAVCLALVIAAAAITMSVTRTAGRKAAVGFFVVTVLYLLISFVVDYILRVPVSPGSTATWTTVLTPFNPFLVLQVLIQPSGHVIPDTSTFPWPLGWMVTHPVAGWCWLTSLLSVCAVTWSSLLVRSLGERQVTDGWLKQLFNQFRGDREPHAVSGNPIAWRERVTRHRNVGSLIGRWGFVAIFLLTFIILTSLYATGSLSADEFRQTTLILVCSELVIVIFAAISLSASAIAKEREDGSLDLLLTTSITPKTYLGGKVHGLVMHLLPMVLVPCITMMTIGLIVLIDSNAVVSDQIIGSSGASSVPLALFAPAILTPIVVIPYISFCLVLGLMWSMRSKGSLSAIISSLILVFVVTGGLGMCFKISSDMGHVGSIFAALSPINSVLATMVSVDVLPSVMQQGTTSANISMATASVISGLSWSLISWGLLRSMSSSFVVTVRRLAGNN